MLGRGEGVPPPLSSDALGQGCVCVCWRPEFALAAPPPPPQGCIRWEGTSEAAPEADRAVGYKCH